jgi:hypothetical protein
VGVASVYVTGYVYMREWVLPFPTLTTGQVYHSGCTWRCAVFACVSFYVAVCVRVAYGALLWVYLILHTPAGFFLWSHAEELCE